MKEVINLSGEKELVPVNTPVKTKGGVHYLHTSEEQADFDARNVAATAKLTSDNAKKEIKKLEGTITIRRLREAILGTDNGWLANQEALIATERTKISN